MDENAVESVVRELVEYVIPVVELLGAAVVVVGAALAIGMFCASLVRMREDSYEAIRLTLGRHLALGLEFQLGADILATAISPTLDDPWRIALFHAPRRPRRRRRPAAAPAPAPPPGLRFEVLRLF